MSGKQKLELTWIGKDKRPKLEPRILLEDASLSYHARHRISDNDSFDNRLIFGDNLLALKALEQEFSGKVKCVFIDPPYNTGSAFTHYDDGLEHSIWLGLMRDRLEIIKRLLSEDGSLWITIDDNEAHYLKVLCDEVFGRKSFVSNVVWQNRYSRSNDASISLSHNHILIYANNPENWKNIRNRLPRSEEQANQYKNPDNDPNGSWRAIPWDAPNLRPNLSYPIKTPTGKVRLPPEGRHWSRTEDQWNDIVASGLAYFGKLGDGVPSFKQYLKDAAPIVPNTWWDHEETGHTDEAKKEMHSLFSKELAFDTPKPERLLNRVIHIATNPGDLVLDSFAGSGTTGTVAHKMGRRWLMVELGEHCHTHIIPRLKKVIDGEDKGGITEAVNWQGGGGFRFCRLGEPVFDGYGRIRPGVGFADLARWVWYRATHQPLATVPTNPLLGVHQGTAYYLLFNGILGDKRPEGGNVLTLPLLNSLPPHDGPRVIYGEACRLHDSTLTALNLRFRQLPYQANA